MHLPLPIFSRLKNDVYPRHFVRFLDGRSGDRITIGHLPGGLSGHLRTLATEVWLSIDYAKKLMRDERMYYENFSEIQNTIDNGFCFRESKFQLSFLWVKDNIRPEIYFLVVKTTKLGDELWLVCFYRIRKQQFPKKLKPHAILRDHAEKDFMG